MTDTRWPNNIEWSAGQHGVRVPDGDGGDYALSVCPGGVLDLPSGRLVVADPFTGLEPSGNPEYAVPAGRWPVQITLADVEPDRPGHHLREAYATVRFADRPEIRRRPLVPEHRHGQALEPGDYHGFGVDSGTGCFVDAQHLADRMPPEADWADLFDDGTPECWFARMDDPNHLRPGLADIPLPGTPSGPNLVLFHTGWGDGFYPVLGGYDADDRLIAVHVDLFVVPGAPDDDAEG